MPCAWPAPPATGRAWPSAPDLARRSPWSVAAGRGRCCAAASSWCRTTSGLCPGGPAPSGPAVSGAGHRGLSVDQVLQQLLDQVPAPRMKPSRALLALFAALLLLAIGLGSLSALGQRLPAQLHTFWWAALAALLLLGLLDALWARRQAVPAEPPAQRQPAAGALERSASASAAHLSASGSPDPVRSPAGRHGFRVPAAGGRTAPGRKHRGRLPGTAAQPRSLRVSAASWNCPARCACGGSAATWKHAARPASTRTSPASTAPN